MLNIEKIQEKTQKTKKQKNNYEEIITKGYLYNFYRVNQLRRQVYKLQLDIEDLQDAMTFYQNFFDIVLYDMYIDSFHEKLCSLFSSNRNKKCKRYADKVKQLLISSDCVFGTLTLRDCELDIDEEIQRKRIQRFFKKLNCRYICNIDFGWENERKHYHFIADVRHIDCDLWKYGFAYIEPIKNKKEFSLADYINKMTNHAVKQTTKNHRIMCNF